MLCYALNGAIFNRVVKMTNKKTQKDIRFEKEAIALQKNLAKRKKQQAEMEKKKTKKELNNG